MGIKSQQNGNEGQRIIVGLLREYGFWVHVTQRKPDGSQPVDIIALRSDCSWLMDAKFVRAENKGRFSFDDIQANQISSMEYAYEHAGIDNLGFAIVFEEEKECPRFLPFSEYMSLKRDGNKSIKKEGLAPLYTYVGN